MNIYIYIYIYIYVAGVYVCAHVYLFVTNNYTSGIERFSVQPRKECHILNCLNYFRKLKEN